MDAADHNEGVTEQAIRYIITRPCLAEGSLRLLKYLRPLFPADGQVQLQDSRGEVFTATVETSSGRLTGVGELYRAHNLGVNDVLHLRHAADEERRYLVECVVKPHARSQASATERPAPAPVVTEKRVVIHATPHVREVRLERVTVQANGKSGSAPATRAAEPAQLHVAQTQTQQAQPAPAQAAPSPTPQVQATQPRSVEQHAVPGQSTVGKSTVGSSGVGRAGAEAKPSGEQPDRGRAGEGRARAGQTEPSRRQDTQARGSAGQPSTVRAVTVQAIHLQSRSGAGQSATPPSRPAAPISTLTARMQQAPATTRAPVGLNAPIQISFPAPSVSAVPARPDDAPKPNNQPTTTIQTVPTQTALAEDAVRAAGQMSGAQVIQAPLTQPGGQRNPEDQLSALARLTGYACEHLGSGVVRLQAELGPQSYSVLIATTPQALTTPAWNEDCDYMALLTLEDQRPQGIPRFTYAALEALLEHARLAPLTPIDLRGYWNTGSFDQESVESVAELVSAHLAQRGSFSHVLLTLAQQPAHSLVHPPRLAERLGSGVNTAELHSILETLSRPPFQALTPLPNGQYYLRSDVRELLQEFGEYAEGMRRRIRPAPLAATGR